MVSQEQFKAAEAQAGVVPPESEKLETYYNESQIEALKKALLVASGFVLVGLWFARSLPGEPLGKQEEGEGFLPSGVAAT